MSATDLPAIRAIVTAATFTDGPGHPRTCPCDACVVAWEHNRGMSIARDELVKVVPALLDEIDRLTSRIDYRLKDGRFVVVEALETEAQGLRVEVKRLRAALTEARKFARGASEIILSATEMCDDEDDCTEARAMLAKWDAEENDDAPHVCPGCHAVGPEPCAPGCIDDEIRQDRGEAMERDENGEIEES